MTITAEFAACELGEWADSIAMHVGDDVREGRIRDAAALVRALEAVRVAADHLDQCWRGEIGWQETTLQQAWNNLREALAAVDRIREGTT